MPPFGLWLDLIDAFDFADFVFAISGDRAYSLAGTAVCQLLALALAATTAAGYNRNILGLAHQSDMPGAVTGFAVTLMLALSGALAAAAFDNRGSAGSFYDINFFSHVVSPLLAGSQGTCSTFLPISFLIHANVILNEVKNLLVL